METSPSPSSLMEKSWSRKGETWELSEEVTGTLNRKDSQPRDQREHHLHRILTRWDLTLTLGRRQVSTSSMGRSRPQPAGDIHSRTSSLGVTGLKGSLGLGLSLWQRLPSVCKVLSLVFSTAELENLNEDSQEVLILNLAQSQDSNYHDC